MTKPHKLAPCILLIALVVCNTSERDWKQAEESNTASGYTEFIAKHPNDPHVIEAKASLDDLDWRVATTDGTFDAYNAYLNRHADGKHGADAKAGIRNLPFQMRILSIAVARKFQAYVGGGANIEPPEPVSFPFGGGGMPLISFSSGGPAFLAGEVASKDATKKLIRIGLSIRNSTGKKQPFKIGDVSFDLSGVRTNDFAAVGYNDRLCAMSDEDRQKVKEIVVQVPEQSTVRLSYVFALTDPESKQGQLFSGKAEPVSFEIRKISTK
jgi:hypothetical protein